MLKTDEALRRVRLITPMLRSDVKTAILSHAVMEASNDVIPKGMKGLHSDFINTYNAVQNALALKLAMDLARIFDLSEGGRYTAEEQDKASVQVLTALLRRDDVRGRLVADASRWLTGVGHISTVGNAPPGVVDAALKDLEGHHRQQDRTDCEKAISELLDLTDRLGVDASQEKAALGRVREFRNRRLAHSLFDKAPEQLPYYNDLNLLLGIAKDAARLASLAIEGLNTELDDQMLRDGENAKGYARCVLDGLQRAADRSES